MKQLVSDMDESSDETIDFDHELSMDEEDVTKSYSSSPSKKRIKLSQETSTQILKFSEVKDFERNLEAEKAKESNNASEESLFKVIGQETVNPTCNPKTVVSSWVSGAVRFSAGINEKQDLSTLDSLPGLDPQILEQLRKTTDVWFPVQSAVLPNILLSERRVLPPRDLVITAPTGSGKTLCFVLPILNSLKFVEDPITSVFALIVAPVQDLAHQIYQEFLKYNIYGAKIALLNGMNDYDTERKILFSRDYIGNSQVHIIVATPGRLMEHLVDSNGVINLLALRFLVVDEADRMLDTARIEWLNVVERRARASANNHMTIANLTNPRENLLLQKILVSATLSLDVDQLHTWNLRCPQLFKASVSEVRKIECGKIDEGLVLPSSLTHQIMLCMSNTKPALLYDFLATNVDFKKVIVFVNSKNSSYRLASLVSLLAREDFCVAEISSNLKGKRRFKTMKRFENGQTRVLIASDVMSRGMDIQDVDLVVNYDPPINERIFFHRAGRTARGLKKGMLLTLLTKDEKMWLKKMLVAQNAWTDDSVIDRRTDSGINKNVMKRYEKSLNKLKQKFGK